MSDDASTSLSLPIFSQRPETSYILSPRIANTPDLPEGSQSLSLPVFGYRPQRSLVRVPQIDDEAPTTGLPEGSASFSVAIYGYRPFGPITRTYTREENLPEADQALVLAVEFQNYAKTFALKFNVPDETQPDELAVGRRYIYFKARDYRGKLHFVSDNDRVLINADVPLGFRPNLPLMGVG